VIAEQFRRRDGLDDLHETALRAEREVERERRLRARQFVYRAECVRQWRAPERQHRHQHGAGTGTTMGSVRHAAFLAETEFEYHAIVFRSPSSSVNSGRQPSVSRAFAAERLWWRISLLASLRTSGVKCEPMRPRIFSASWSTVRCSSFEKLNAS